MQSNPAKHHRILTHPVFLALMGILFVVFFLFIMPAGEALIYQNQPSSLLDMLFHYTPDQTGQLIQSYGSEGRAAYIQFTWTYDLAFPLVYGLFFYSILTALIKRSNPTWSLLRRAACLPILTMSADYLENAGITMLLKSYPVLNNTFIRISSCFTSLKWVLLVLTSLSAGYLVIQLVITSRQALRTKDPENCS
jgi:hypothetical protein